MLLSADPLYDEKELLHQLKAGDQKAFGVLYQQYSNRIYSHLLRLTQAEHLADELLQDTFVILWEKRHTINPDLSIKSWLYKVAANEVSQFYRKLARDKKLQEYVILSFTEAYSHTEEDIYAKESKALLNNAIAQLSPQRQQAFTLCKIEGRSYEETAKIMGIAPSTVSNHLVKASDSIRQYIFRSKGNAAILIIALLFKSH